MTSFLDVRLADKRFGAFHALKEVSFTVRRGEFVSLLGPSGCGKTSLLRGIAGLMRFDSGTISLDGRDLTKIPAHKRNIGVVFQNYALFPHLNVASNVAFGLRAAGMRKQEALVEVQSALALVRMEDFATRPVNTLSGGQQQRVAVARALATKPQLLLLDEPFSALDRKLRERMQIELRQILRKLDITAVFVTHDQDEAFIMSDRIAVMERGEIRQFADGPTIYSQPESASTLTFVGMSTRLGGTVTTCCSNVAQVETTAGLLRAKPRDHFEPGNPVIVAVRPENFSIGASSDERRNSTRFQITDRAYLGSKIQLFLGVAGEDFALAEINPALGSDLVVGDWIDLNWPVEETLIYHMNRSAEQ
jgi:putative spermidine/putrescine transport system ATP-binding protein